MVQFAGGVSTLGNTAGNTGTKFGTVVLAGTSNITLSQITGSAGVHTIQISAGGGGGGGVAAAGVSTGGNTAGNTGTQTGTIVFQATGNLTASQITGGGGVHTVQLSADGPKLSVFANHFGSGSTVTGTANATLLVFPLCPDRGVFPGVMTVSTMGIGFSANLTATASSSSHTHRFSIGIYTLANSTQLSLINSVSTSVGSGAGNTGNSSLYHGPRLLTVHSSAWSSQPVFTQTQYWVGLWIRSSNLAPAMSYSGFRWMTSQFSGHLGVGNTNSSSSRPFPGMGVYSASFTTGMPAAIGFSELRQANASAPVIPLVIFNNHGF